MVVKLTVNVTPVFPTVRSLGVTAAVVIVAGVKPDIVVLEY